MLAIALLTSSVTHGRADETVGRAVTGGVIERVGPAGLKMFRWDFSRVGDANFDSWPDDWVRHEGSGYPRYVLVRIAPHDAELGSQILQIDTALAIRWSNWRERIPQLPLLPPSLADALVDRCLRVELDGGGAMLESPPEATSNTFQYQFNVDIQTEQLRHDRAWAEIVFWDESKRMLATRSTESVTKTRGWKRLTIDDLVPPAGAKFMSVRLRVEGSEDGLEDIRGTVNFDNIVFRQFPQLVIQTDERLGVYEDTQPVTVTAELLGMPDDGAAVRLKLYDHDGQLIDAQTHPVAPGSATASRQRIRFDWQLPTLPPGFYRVAGSMESDRGASLANETSFVVLTDLLARGSIGSPDEAGPEAATASPASQTDSSQAGSLPFGWTLPASLMQSHRDHDVHEREIARWLGRLGVGWAKLPVWFAPDETTAADAAVHLAVRLMDERIQVVGMLDEPPRSRLESYHLRDLSDLRAATLLRDATIWRSELETIMNRMTLRIRSWQLGGDRDHSFTGQPRLPEMIDTIADSLQGFGQPIEIAISWPWLEPMTPSAGHSWRAVQRGTPNSLTAEELAGLLRQNEPTIAPEISASEGRASKSSSAASSLTRAALATWITLDPISERLYDRDTRVTDLVLRMATTRNHDVQAAFATEPMSGRHGLLTTDARPGELLLPWRTTSLLIGDTKQLGSLRLQNRSHNLVFTGPRQSVLMIWSDQPATEELFLGDNVYEVDVWGRRRDLPLVPSENLGGRGRVQRIEVDSVPRFIVGIDPSLAKFRMTVDLDRHRIDSVPGASQSVAVRFANPISLALQGKVTLVSPPSWRVEQPTAQWELLPRQPGQSRFDIVLSNNATIGTYDVPLDFEFDTSPPTSIRVFRRLSVGPEGFNLMVTTRMVGEQLRVKLELTNLTDRVAHFDCLVFAGSNRQYERRIVTIEAGETNARTIDWSDGRSLIGTTMLLRAIEQDGRRVINHALVVQP